MSPLGGCTNDDEAPFCFVVSSLKYLTLSFGSVTLLPLKGAMLQLRARGAGGLASRKCWCTAILVARAIASISEQLPAFSTITEHVNITLFMCPHAHNLALVHCAGLFLRLSGLAYLLPEILLLFVRVHAGFVPM